MIMAAVNERMLLGELKKIDRLTIFFCILCYNMRSYTSCRLVYLVMAKRQSEDKDLHENVVVEKKRAKLDLQEVRINRKYLDSSSMIFKNIQENWK